MRRCKYELEKIVPHFLDGELLLSRYFYCLYDNVSGCLLDNLECPYYTPVELDPYWKDIVDETNRRLYGR